eukprot:g74748.t1
MWTLQVVRCLRLFPRPGQLCYLAKPPILVPLAQTTFTWAYIPQTVLRKTSACEGVARVLVHHSTSRTSCGAERLFVCYWSPLRTTLSIKYEYSSAQALRENLKEVWSWSAKGARRPMNETHSILASVKRTYWNLKDRFGGRDWTEPKRIAALLMMGIGLMGTAGLRVQVKGQTSI